MRPPFRHLYKNRTGARWASPWFHARASSSVSDCLQHGYVSSMFLLQSGLRLSVAQPVQPRCRWGYEMAGLSQEIRIVRRGGPLFPIKAQIPVDGQVSGGCLRQLWRLGHGLGPSAPTEVVRDEACGTSCLRQLGLLQGFTPLADRLFSGDSSGRR